MSSSSSTEKKLLVLKAADGEEFEVEEAVAIQAKTIRNMVEDGCSSDVIPIPNVDSTILAKVIEYCRAHVQVINDDHDQKKKAAADEEEKKKAEAEEKAEKERLRAFDEEFVNTDKDSLFFLILAANYLNVERLLDILTGKVADMLKGKSPEQMRQVLGIKNDFTPEEEQAIRQETPFAFLTEEGSN